MEIAIKIDDNHFQVAYRDETDYAVVFHFDGLQDELEARLLVNGHFVYTGDLVNPVKLANPGIALFTDVLYPDVVHFVESSTKTWDKDQLLAILFKKILFEVNTHSVYTVDSVVISYPAYFNEKDLAEINAGLKANLVEEVFTVRDNTLISDEFTRNDGALVVSINESDFRDFAAGANKIPCNLRRTIFNDLRKQMRRQNLNLRSTLIDDFIISLEIEALLKKMLNGENVTRFPILLGHNVFYFEPDKKSFRLMLERRIRQILKSEIVHDCNSIYFTGRLLKSSLVVQLLRNSLENIKIPYTIDTQNDLLIKRMLNTNPV